jgi:hypothetical protein
MATGPLVIGADTTAWVTSGVALVTGLLGLFAGASAAAVITTRQQTIEVFRNRMIEAADTVVGRLSAVSRAAQHVERRLSDLQPEESFGPDEMNSLRDAAWFRDEMEQELARLYVVFHDANVGDMANELAGAIERWIALLEDASRGASAERKSMLDAAMKQGEEVRIVREKLLREMNRQIRLEGRPRLFARRRA